MGGGDPSSEEVWGGYSTAERRIQVAMIPPIHLLKFLGESGGKEDQSRLARIGWVVTSLERYFPQTYDAELLIYLPDV